VELVAITRELLPHRLALLAGAVIAVVAGLLAAGALTLHPPGPGSGEPATATALSRVQLDAPRPLVVDKKVKGAETITPRTRIFALLMSEGRVVDGIARRAGLEPADVQVTDAGSESPLEVTPLADEAASTTLPKGDHVVTVSADPQVPVIALMTTGPDAEAAERLAVAATAELVDLVERIAPGEEGRRYVQAEPLGRPAVETTAGGIKWHVGLAVALLIFVLWCSAVVLASAGLHAWRAGAGPARAADRRLQRG
jgi:hypothetical protein